MLSCSARPQGGRRVPPPGELVRGDAGEVVPWLRPHHKAPERWVSREERSESTLGLFCCLNAFTFLLSAQSKVGQIETI